jgi:hypothetical protein
VSQVSDQPAALVFVSHGGGRGQGLGGRGRLGLAGKPVGQHAQRAGALSRRGNGVYLALCLGQERRPMIG